MHKLGLVVGKFAPPHKGHQLVIDTALKNCQQVLVLVYSNPDFANMPSQARAQWLRQAYQNKNIKIFVPENTPQNKADDFTQREFVLNWLKANHLKPNAVFGSDAYIPGFAKHIDAEAVMVDFSRSDFPISGTTLREAWLNSENPEAVRQLQMHLSQEIVEASKMWRESVRKVVFLGAESTGKSTIAEHIANELNCPFVPEYGREVWQNKNGELEPQDYIHIAEHHKELEELAIQDARKLGKPFIFIDTNAITTAFLGYAYEGDVPTRVMELAKLAEQRYHHVFLCGTDIVFEQDGWRDNDMWRTRAQNLIRYDLNLRGVHFTEIFGDLKSRIQAVKKVIMS